MFLRATAFATAVAFALPVYAQEGDADALFDALAMPQIIEIMREEGINYGQTIGQDLFSGAPSSEWAATVEMIYEYDRMEGTIRADFVEALDGVDVAPMLAFFTSEQGQQIIGLEVSARRALLDDAVEEASKEAAARAASEDTERYQLVQTFIETNDLVESNVVGALNSNYAFYLGLMQGGAFGGVLTEEQVLTDVWSQEEDIRQNSEEWLYSFLLMAYQPLEDADIEAYIAFSETESGEALNRALFAGFDPMFEGISSALGLAAATQMTSQEL